MVLLLLVTASYVAGVVWVRRSRRARLAVGSPVLPEDDQPPSTAVGWPPAGPQFTTYVDDGFAALDDYLSEGYAT